MANTYVSTSFPGLWNNAENTYGIPQDIIQGFLTPNSIVDLFPWQFSNQPVKPQDWLKSLSGESGDGSFTEGGCPVEVEWSATQFTVAAKSLGRCTPRTSYVGLASKQNVTPATRRIVDANGIVKELDNEWDYQLYLVLLGCRRAMEYLTINGDSSVTANNFDGLNRIIRAPVGGRLDVNGVGVPDANSIVIDNANAAVTVNLLYQFIGSLEANGANPADLYFILRPGLVNEIARLLALDYNDPGAKRQEILQEKTFPLYGVNIPYRTTQWVDATGTGSTWYSSLYAICPVFGGLPNIWYEYFDLSNLVQNADLFAGPGAAPSHWYMVPSDRGTTYCTSTKFCLWTHGRLVVAAPQVLGKITGIQFTFQNVREVTTP